jgi:hypothetical protein
MANAGINSVPGRMSSSSLHVSSLTGTGKSAYYAGQKNTAPHSDSRKAVGESDDNLSAHLSMHKQYAMVSQPASSHTPARRMAPADDEFYPTFTMHALMRIFKNQSLAVHHGMVIQAIMFVFKSLGLR